MGDTINIMVLEDNEDDRFFIKRVIKEVGDNKYDLYENYNNFHQGLNKEIHVCILDHYLDGNKTGLDVLREIKEKNKGSFVIVYTGVQDADILIEYNNNAADKIVGKWKDDHLDKLRSFIKIGLEVAKGNVGLINYLLSRNLNLND